MPENLSPMLLEVRAAAQRFLDEEVLPRSRQLESYDEVPKAMLDEVREASKKGGFFYKTQPEAFGGQPASTLELTMLRELFAAANSPLTGAIFGPGPGVLHGVGGELKRDYLEPLLRGEKRGAFAFTEPDSAPRPSWAQMQGEVLVVNGQKSYVTGGDKADFVTALLNVEQEDGAKVGTAMVVIDMAAEGVVVERRFESLDGSGHVALRFDGVRVPVSQVIGEPGEGMPRALASIGNVRMMVSAQAVGMSQWVLGFVEEHLKAPHRSGAPLGSREGVRLRYAEQRIAAYVARSALYRTARLVDSGENAVNETMATKVFCTEMVGQVVDTAVQLVGGQALVRGQPLERLYRQVRALRLVEGASDLLRLNIAKGRLDMEKGRV